MYTRKLTHLAFIILQHQNATLGRLWFLWYAQARANLCVCVCVCTRANVA